MLAVAGCGADATSDTDATDSSTSGSAGSTGGEPSSGTTASSMTASSSASSDEGTETSSDETRTSGTESGDDGSSGGSDSSGSESDGDSTSGSLCSVDPDQASTAEDDNVIYPPWQSFTAGVTGDLVEIDAMPNTYCGGDGIDGDLTIYEGEGTDGTVLYQEAYPAFFMGGINVVTFVVDPPLPVVAGTQYTFELSGTCGLRHSNADAYPGGMGGGYASVDMVFETRVETCE